MQEAAPLTNKERRDNVAYLFDAFDVAPPRATDVLEPDDVAAFASGEGAEQQRLFFRVLCYGVLAAQPAPESVIFSDWQRLLAAGVIEDIYQRTFDLAAYALDPPVSRGDSKGKVIEFTRLSETRDVWSRLLPEPPDPDVAVDVLHAASGGALKSRAFWVVREMRRLGLWQRPALDPFGYVPDGRVRKRASRMGLIDLPEKADTFADMKAVSRALHAVMRLARKEQVAYDLPLSMAAQRCELCDVERMAVCSLPHCRMRRERLYEG